MKKNAYSAAGSNNFADRRWKMSAFDILSMKPTRKWPDLSRAKATWVVLKNILFSKRVKVRVGCTLVHMEVSPMANSAWRFQYFVGV